MKFSSHVQNLIFDYKEENDFPRSVTKFNLELRLSEHVIYLLTMREEMLGNGKAQWSEINK